MFRPSMRKFESSHRRLEVLQTSRAQVVFLNHQLIMLLSNLGIPDDVFMSLQRNMLDKLAGERKGRKVREECLTKIPCGSCGDITVKSSKTRGSGKEKLYSTPVGINSLTLFYF